jgi:hypothetical protein
MEDACRLYAGNIRHKGATYDVRSLMNCSDVLGEILDGDAPIGRIAIRGRAEVRVPLLGLTQING